MLASLDRSHSAPHDDNIVASDREELGHYSSLSEL